MFLGTTALFATNGDTLIGLGAKSHGMGGVGIGMGHGAESALANPALITAVETTEISSGGTLFMPDVSYDGGAGYQQSTADTNVIPEVSIASKMNDNFYLGTGGMGTDYRDDTTGSTIQMVTNLQLIQFGVPVAYKRDGSSFGVTGIVQYGALDINYNNGTNVGAGLSYAMEGHTFAFDYKRILGQRYGL